MLRHGDLIRIGQSQFLLEFPAAAARHDTLVEAATMPLRPRRSPWLAVIAVLGLLALAAGAFLLWPRLQGEEEQATPPPAATDVAVGGATTLPSPAAESTLPAPGETALPTVAPPSPEADTRAFAVWAAAKTILDGLGAWDAIAPVAQPIAAIEIGDSDRDDVMRPARVTYDAHTRDGVPAGYIVPAAALHLSLIHISEPTRPY